VYLATEALVEGGADFPGGGYFTMSAENGGVGFAPKHDSDVPDEVTEYMNDILVGLKHGWIETGVDPTTGDLLPETK